MKDSTQVFLTPKPRSENTKLRHFPTSYYLQNSMHISSISLSKILLHHSIPEAMGKAKTMNVNKIEYLLYDITDLFLDLSCSLF